MTKKRSAEGKSEDKRLFQTEGHNTRLARVAQTLGMGITSLEYLLSTPASKKCKYKRHLTQWRKTYKKKPILKEIAKLRLLAQHQWQARLKHEKDKRKKAALEQRVQNLEDKVAHLDSLITAALNLVK